MKFLLTSSGLKNEGILRGLKELVGKDISETSILFIPTAANTGVDDKSWLIDNLINTKEAGFKSIDLLDIAGLKKEEWEPHFQAADVICFGGGNERYLARIIEASGVRESLSALLETKVYMGISAGSMVVGSFLNDEHNAALFPEEDYGDEQGVPLKLLEMIFIPHMNSDWFTHVRKELLENIKEEFKINVYALDDETALKIHGDVIEIVGKGDHWFHTV